MERCLMFHPHWYQINNYWFWCHLSLNRTEHQNIMLLQGVSRALNLPSLFAAWLVWTFHNWSHNMKALAILSHSWLPFLPLTCLYEKNNFCGSLYDLLEYFRKNKLTPDYPWKSCHPDHQWADLVMAWLP